MIRKMFNKEKEIDEIMAIWARGNIKNHGFIDKDYWLENYNIVKNEYLPNSVTYVYEKNNEIQGFISIMSDGYIGALFVDEKYKRNGIGRKLINYSKNLYDNLTLKVYEKNINAILFYVAMGFKNINISIDESTNEIEYTMQWRK